MSLEQKGSALEGVSWEEVLHEMRKAGLRVGWDPGDEMRWFIRFSEINPADLSIGDWSNLRYELIYVSMRSVSGFPDRRNPNSQPANFFGLGGLPKNPQFSRAEVYTFSKRIQGYLLAVLKKETLECELPGFRVVFHPSSRDEMYRMNYESDDLWVLLTYLFFDRLGDTAHLLHACPECSRFFLADRKNQRYCSLRCQTRVASRKHLGTPKHRIGKRGRPQKLSRPKQLLSKPKEE